ncbi:hypothetical protein [Pseudomonas sp.]|uniref:hypothetical protein n=1 Tax=Pseudomonas sp. TaxID=306 RepID=UPI003D0C0977
MSGTVKTWDLRLLERIAEERRKSRPVEPFGLQAISAIAEDEAGETIRRNAGILAQEASNALLEPSQPMIAVFSGPVDSRTCPLCAALVGQRVRTDSPEYRTYSPPLHINCRHYWLYMHPDTPGAREDFTPPDPELVDRFGHFVRRPLEYLELKVPARPTGRDFIVRRYADHTEIEFVPHAEISPRARRTLIELVQRSRQGAWRLSIGELTALMSDMRTGLAELENWGLIRVVTRAGEEQATFMVARSERDLRQRLRAIPEWQRRRIVAIEDMGPAGHGLGAGLRQYRVVYRDLSEAEVQITQRGRSELARGRRGAESPPARRGPRLLQLSRPERRAMRLTAELRGGWPRVHNYVPPLFVEDDRALSKLQAQGDYIPERHLARVRSRAYFRRIYRSNRDASLRRVYVVAHESGHATQDGWELRDVFPLAAEPLNDAASQVIALRTVPEEARRYASELTHPFVGPYVEVARALLRFADPGQAETLLAAGKAGDLASTIRERIETALRESRVSASVKKRLGEALDRDLPDEPLDVIAIVQALDDLADAAGMARLSPGQFRGIILQAAAK